MTDYSALCTAAGLHVLSVQQTATQVCVTVRKVPQSASGLAALTAKLGVAVTVGLGDGSGNVELWFMKSGQMPDSEKDAYGR